MLIFGIDYLCHFCKGRGKVPHLNSLGRWVTIECPHCRGSKLEPLTPMDVQRLLRLNIETEGQTRRYPGRGRVGS